MKPTNTHLPLALTLCLTAACGTAPPPEDLDRGTEAALAPPPFFAGDTANHAVFATDISVWEAPVAESQMDCLWAAGVRHVVVGTQETTIARQQLAMAVSRGMTVDAYVFIYWDRDFVTQVEAAFAMVKGFPIGSMWLDIEEESGAAALGGKGIIARVQAGLADCASHGVGCGIYTGPGFWKTYVGDAPALASTPLWYAQYNGKRSLSDWSTEHFGGFGAPRGKQFQTAPLCGMGGADWDVMQVDAKPSVVVDRAPPLDTGAPPTAPTGLFPENGSVDLLGYAKLMSGTVPFASTYQLALERWSGSAWAPYYTWTSPDAYVKVSPPSAPAVYRFRVRAQNSHGFGAWSGYSTFDYGRYTGPRPGVAPAPSSTGTGAAPPPPPPPPPPPAGVPGSLEPSGGETVTADSITVRCAAVTSATSYQFAIESATGGSFSAYYTYTSATPSRTFYPATRGIDFRFRARAMTAGSYGPWSEYATFHVK